MPSGQSKSLRAAYMKAWRDKRFGTPGNRVKCRTVGCPNVACRGLGNGWCDRCFRGARL